MSTLNDAPFPFHRASQPTDALAELFLGDGPLAPARASESPNDQPRPRDLNAARAPSMLDITPTAPPSPMASEIRSIAPDPHAEAAALPEPRIEALILGHLPVLASAWVGQFTKLSVENAGGSVALLRVRAGTASVDLFDAYADVPPCSSMEDAIRAANAHARRWLIQVDETDEPTLASLPSIGSLTLLCGSDDAAVVACYRTLKSLGSRDETSEKSVRLAIMGAAGDKAKAASDKLAAASRTFLGRELELVPGATKVSAWNSRTLFRGMASSPVESLVTLLECRGTSKRAEAAPTPPEAPIIASDRSRNVTRTDAFRAALRDVMKPGSESGPLESREPCRPLEAVLPIPIAPASMSPAAPSWIAPKTPSAPTPPQTTHVAHAPAPNAVSARGTVPAGVPSSFVALIDGLSPISMACPVAPGVALARDAAGSLHLVARSESASDVGRAWCELDAALGWAMLNAPLLAAATSVRIAQPTRHLLAREPREARRLLDNGVRVYALCANKDGTPIAGVPLN
ncbi:MAG: hypothetical protein U0638_04410 [Phycisphaerales bacterium]